MVKTVNKFLSSGHLEFIVSTVFNVWPQSAGNCRIFHDSSFSPISLIFLDSVGLHVVDVVCIRFKHFLHGLLRHRILLEGEFLAVLKRIDNLCRCLRGKLACNYSLLRCKLSRKSGRR